MQHNPDVAGCRLSATWLRGMGQRDIVGAIMRGVDHPDKSLQFVREGLALLAVLA